jgi:hypothetical protein
LRHLVCDLAPDRGRDVDPLHRVAVLPIRQARAFGLEPVAKRIDQLINRDCAVTAIRDRRSHALLLDELAETLLGFALRQTIRLASLAHLAEAGD